MFLMHTITLGDSKNKFKVKSEILIFDDLGVWGIWGDFSRFCDLGLRLPRILIIIISADIIDFFSQNDCSQSSDGVVRVSA